MSIDERVVSELERAGQWLEARAGASLRRGDANDAAGSTPAHWVTPRRWRGVAAVAATSIGVIVGLVALVASRDRSGGDELPSDPAGILYVLPRPGTGLEVSSGDSSTFTTEPATVTVFGQPDTAGVYEHLMIVLVSAQRLIGLDGEATTVDLDSGRRAELVALPPYLDVVQHRSGFWITIKTVATDRALALDFLNRISLDAAGNVTAAGTAPQVAIEDLSVDRQALVHTAHITIGEETATEPVEIWTTSNPSALLHDVVGTTARPTAVGDREGWLFEPSIAREGTMLVWRATPSRMVAVRSLAPRDTVLDVAATLEIVSQTTWNVGTGN